MKNGSKDSASEKELIDRVYWLTRLRWVAILGVIATLLTVPRFFQLSLEVRPLCWVAVFLAAYNGLGPRLMRRLQGRQKYWLIKALANLQIFLDLTCLALLIHFSGGIENPFYFYFIFHIIIAGILLSRRETVILATYAALIFSVIVFGEQRGLLHHYALLTAPAFSLYESPAYVLGVFLVFVSTLYISAYLTTSISNRLHERERSLTGANELLAEKDRIKSEYVLRVSHDLKEDLAAIHTCVEPVQKELTGRLNAEQMNLLSRARERSKQLIVYIDALLEITKLNLTEKLEMSTFPVEELIREISGSIGSMAQQDKKTFEVQMDPGMLFVKGVRVYIEEALVNILKNALKYTPEGGKITLRVQSDPPWLRVTVTDTGIGIPAEDLPKIFTEFFRARNARALLKKGTGLGLSIAKKIVEMHHGKIGIESPPGQGTCVTLELPLSAVNGARA